MSPGPRVSWWGGKSSRGYEDQAHRHPGLAERPLREAHEGIPQARLWLGYRIFCLSRALKKDGPEEIQKHAQNVEYWLNWAGGHPISAYANVPPRVIAHFAAQLFTGPPQRDP